MNSTQETLWPEDDLQIGRSGLRIAVAVFCVFVLLPAVSLLLPSLRPETVGEKSPASLGERLSRWENSAKSLPLFEDWRRTDQAILTQWIGAGNRRVFVGKGGWLYYRPDLESITGKGPYHVEPKSVTRARPDRDWQPPVPVVKAFSSDLANRGVRLIFVPVPTKPMICRDGLGLDSGLGAPTFWETAKRDLQSSGVEFVDLLPTISAASITGTDDGKFLKQDTHWTPSMMETVARKIAQISQTKSGSAPDDRTGDDSRSYPVESLHRSASGDLVGMLDFGKAQESIFPPESAELLRPVKTEARSESPDLCLIGDSFANIFDDPSLGFSEAGEGSIGAGFVAHLSAALGRPIESITINGGGATAVRESFATLPATRRDEIRTVVWLISARDLLLPELPARRAGIEWRQVVLPEVSTPGTSSMPTAPAASDEILATLRELSPIGDPTQTPYASAIYSALFTTEDGKERIVFLWAFRDRKLDPAASLQKGHRYRLHLIPLERSTNASRATRIDDLFRIDLDPWFAETWELAD